MLTRSPSLSSSQLLEKNSQRSSDAAATSTEQPKVSPPKKSPYQADQQVKFLHLQAEVESLLQQLKTLKQQRLATASCDPVGNQH